LRSDAEEAELRLRNRAVAAKGHLIIRRKVGDN
jgi:hypothetical protein